MRGDSLKALKEGMGLREGDLPEITGKYRGKSLIICGDAENVWIDLEEFGARSNQGRGKVKKDGFDIMTINKIVETLPGDIEHAYSNEPELLKKFIAARRCEYRHEFEGPKHTHGCNQGAKHHWPWRGWGTSGLGACLTGIALGYDKIVLCGLGLEDIPHNGEPHWRRTNFTSEASDQKDEEINRFWKMCRDKVFGGKVKSMSGRTRKWLGRPA